MYDDVASAELMRAERAKILRFLRSKMSNLDENGGVSRDCEVEKRECGLSPLPGLAGFLGLPAQNPRRSFLMLGFLNGGP